MTSKNDTYFSFWKIMFYITYPIGLIMLYVAMPFAIMTMEDNMPMELLELKHYNFKFSIILADIDVCLTTSIYKIYIIFFIIIAVINGYCQIRAGIE